MNKKSKVAVLSGQEKPKQPKEPKEPKEPKKEIRYIDKGWITGKNKLYSCNPILGKVIRAKTEKQYFKNKDTGVITVENYIEIQPTIYYTSATKVEEAILKFNAMFLELEEKIARDGEIVALEKQDNIVM